MRAWRTRLVERREREARDQVAREEHERQRAAAADASLRYDWVESALPSGRLAVECPVCAAEPQAASRAATEAAHCPASAGTGAGLNVAAASFLPHAYTDEHLAAASASLRSCTGSMWCFCCYPGGSPERCQ